MRIFAIFAPFLLFSLPVSPQFIAGEGTSELQSKTMEICLSDNSIIHWESFDVAPSEHLNFQFPHVNGSVLNRVVGSAKSEILGSITSNGSVLLLNPNGVLIGKEARIDTMGWIASTLDLQDRAFLETKEWLFAGASNAKIEMHGRIRSERIALFGQDIFCCGSLDGIQIDIAAGSRALWTENGLQTFPTPGSLAFSGHSTAETLSLFGDEIIFSGAFSGDSIFVGGSREGKNPLIANASRVVIAPEATISTCREGEAIFFSGGILSFEGTVFSPGGFVEASGLKHLAFQGHVDTDRTGTLLLDPNEITIVVAPGMTSPAPLTALYDGSPAVSATILNTDLSGLLGGTSVVIQTNGAIGGGSGNIVIDPDAFVSWATGTNLTLHAHQSILINGTSMMNSIQATGPASVVTLIADQGDVVLTATPGRPAVVEVTALHTAGTNAIHVLAPNGSLTIVSALDSAAQLKAGDTTSAGDARVVASALNFFSGVGATANAVSGIEVGRGDIYLTVSGPMHFVGGDAISPNQANASAVAGIGPMGMPLGGNLYFTAGSIDFDSTSAMSGGQTGTSLTAYGATNGTGNVTGTVVGDVLCRAGIPVASGSGISSLFEGEINLAIGGNVTFISNPGPSMTFCGTGIRTLFSLGAGSTRNVNVAIGGDLLAISGGGMDSGAGIGGFGDVSVAVAGSAIFRVTNGSAGGLSGDGLFSSNGSIRFASRTLSFFGNSATPLASHVFALQNVSLAAQGNISFDYADVSSTSNNLTIDSTGGSILIGNSTILQAANQLLALGALNIEMRDSTAISTNDRIIFVVDNAFPSPPLIGLGSFITNPSLFTAPLGVSIYTARQGQNSISSTTFNGATFFPGTLFINTLEEVWCTYYPDGVTTFPFTIFYKDCRSQVTYEANLIISELLRDLHPYDEAFGWLEMFSISDGEFFKDPYFISRRQLIFDTPKSWTTTLFGR